MGLRQRVGEWSTGRRQAASDRGTGSVESKTIVPRADDEDFAALTRDHYALRAAMVAIKQAAVTYGVNDQVGAAIAHAEVIMRSPQPHYAERVVDRVIASALHRRAMASAVPGEGAPTVRDISRTILDRLGVLR